MRHHIALHYAFIIEELEHLPEFNSRPMFSCLGIYLGEKLVLVLANKEEPWNGVLVPTGREWHESLQKDWPVLKAHSFLGKWLYVSQTDPEFELVVNALVGRILKKDQRIGVIGQEKKSGTRRRPLGRTARDG